MAKNAWGGILTAPESIGFDYLTSAVKAYSLASGIDNEPYACPRIILHGDGSGHFEFDLTNTDRTHKTTKGPSFSGYKNLTEVVDSFTPLRELDAKIQAAELELTKLKEEKERKKRFSYV